VPALRAGIAVLSLEGYSVKEVTEQAGRTESKVYRVRRLLRDRLERMNRDR
jgi:hypothetical protein